MRTARSVVLVGALFPALLLGCGGGAGPQSPAGQGVEVAMSPPSAYVEVGGNVTFAAAVTGTADTSVAWDVEEAGGGTVDQNGAYTAPATTGAFHVRATSRADPTKLGVAYVEVVGTIPDPTQLPTATTAQQPLTAAYAALNVPALAAGGWYLDPTTGVRVYRLTSSTFPASGNNWLHDYAEGGDEVSLPHTGTTRTILVRNPSGGGHWLIDFTPGVGVSNARQLTGSLSPFMDLAFTFSNNPATPYYAYVSTGSTITRFDVRTLAAAPGGGWPVTGETSAMWLQHSINDQAFVWMRGASGSGGVVHYTPSTATKRTQPGSLGPVDGVSGTLNEPKLERDGRYVMLNLNEQNKGIVWDTQTGTLIRGFHADDGPPYYPPTAHIGSVRGGWLGLDWNASNPGHFSWLDPLSTVSHGVDLADNAYVGSLGHVSANWIQASAAIGDQWAVSATYGGPTYLAGGGPVMLTENGERRLLAHPYNTSGTYEQYAFCKLSPDGRYVLFTSNMNGSSRSDLFLAEMPTR